MILSGHRARYDLINNFEGLREAPLSNSLCQDLFNSERDATDGQRALRVVDVDISFGNICWRKDILSEFGYDLSLTLLHEASLSFGRIFNLHVLLHFLEALTHDKHLLELHVVLWVIAEKASFDIVFHFGFRLLLISAIISEVYT